MNAHMHMPYIFIILMESFKVQSFLFFVYVQCSCLENPHGQRSPVSYSPWGHTVRHNWVTKHSTAYVHIYMYTHFAYVIYNFLIPKSKYFYMLKLY